MIDPDNPVVKLCVQGMQAEAEDRLEDALMIFRLAWERSADDFEACIAAHYLARHQADPNDMLYWNQQALDKAQAVGDERVGGFFPSLYLNMGYSYETLGDLEAAGRFYELAANRLHDLPPGSYSEVVQEAVARGQERIRMSKAT